MTNKKSNKQKVVIVERKPKPKRNNGPKKKKNSTLGDILSDVGAWGGNRLSTMFGLGAYTLKSNSLIDAASGRQVPFMHSSSETLRLCHREYICDINSTNTFTLHTMSINPSLSSSFPYLSRIASCFQQYEFKGLVYEFKSTSASALNSTNTALGTVMLACQYDSSDPDFTSKQQILNEMWSVDGKPSEDILLPVECHPAERVTTLCNLRTDRDPLPAVTTTYDWGKFSIATVGSQAVANVGELWVSYDVAFYKPTIVDTAVDVSLEVRASSDTWSVHRLGDTVNFEQADSRLTYSDGVITIAPLPTQRQVTLSVLWASSDAVAIADPTFVATNATALWTNLAPPGGYNVPVFQKTITYTITDPFKHITFEVVGGTVPSGSNPTMWWTVVSTV